MSIPKPLTDDEMLREAREWCESYIGDWPKYSPSVQRLWANRVAGFALSRLRKLEASGHLRHLENCDELKDIPVDGCERTAGAYDWINAGLECSCDHPLGRKRR